jgi:hypothetical protein
MTITKGTGLVKSKQLLIQTNIALEDLLDVAATMLSVWKGDDDKQKKRFGAGLKQLVQCMFTANQQQSTRIFWTI